MPAWTYEARAYAIPNPDNMDTGNVRIKVRGVQHGWTCHDLH